MSKFKLQPLSVATPDGLRLKGDMVGDPACPAVVLLHGGGQTRHSWDQVAQRLAQAGYHVINYDARGHGESDWSPTGAYGLPALASDLRAILATITTPVALVGASLGGMTAFYAVGSAARPIATAMVLVDIVLRPSPVGVDRIQTFMRSHEDGFATLDEAVAAVGRYNPGRRPSGTGRGLSKNLRLREDGRLYWHWDPRLLDIDPLAKLSLSDELTEVSPGVAIPTLLVRGVLSDMVDDEGIADMQALVPHMMIAAVEGAGHMVAGDRNDIFGERILAFLRTIHPAHR